ncbi:MAG: glycosyl hydrolase family 28-related protein, partial [Arenibacter algicola]|nr:glycosyl hydrolase family 28-related protein [Arenibacter algicola]
MITRPLFSIGIFLFFLISGLTLNSCKEAPKKQSEVVDVFAAADRIVNDIVVPEFPDRNYSIMDFGAVPDGTTDNTQAIKLAIESCHTAGGGKVIVPSGRFLTGPIHLKSNVNLHLEEGAVVLFSKDSKAYLPVV